MAHTGGLRREAQGKERTPHQTPPVRRFPMAWMRSAPRNPAQSGKLAHNLQISRADIPLPWKGGTRTRGRGKSPESEYEKKGVNAIL